MVLWRLTGGRATETRGATGGLAAREAERLHERERGQHDGQQGERAVEEPRRDGGESTPEALAVMVRLPSLRRPHLDVSLHPHRQRPGRERNVAMHGEREGWSPPAGVVLDDPVVSFCLPFTGGYAVPVSEDVSNAKLRHDGRLPNKGEGGPSERDQEREEDREPHEVQGVALQGS